MQNQFRAAAQAARRCAIALAFSFCGMAAGQATSREPINYCAYELGRGLVAEAINNQNQIVGTAAMGDLAQAFIWDSSRGARLLGVLPGAAISLGNDINDLRQVVGTSGARPFIWDARNGMRPFATLGGESATATHINDAGQIIGLSATAAEDGEHLYFRDVNGDVEDLGVGRIPFGLTDAGQVGFSTQSQQPPPTADVFLWDARKGERELRGFPDNRLILPSAINNRLHIVGSAVQDDQLPHAMRWTRGQGMRFLPSLNEEGFSQATDVNSRGTVVGYVDMAFGVPIRPFIWTKRSGTRDLTTLLAPSSLPLAQADTIAARALNDLGWIAINTSDTVGTNPRAYVLTPKFRGDESECAAPPPVFGED
ncbi:hypothetical protein [Peristeroidobacter agariperforans]|uniref:hypothetical protein n=1 Tax=Peristeroidobacter agariperforans TaxID=268404 RepID=UPI00101C6E48|nr:hypothetical protein [Peristeroidobacter agariperforans]